MGKTTEFPTIADWLRQLDAYPNATVFGKTRKYTARDLATELRALLAERAVLQKECNDRAECEQSLARWNEELAADRDAWQEKAEDAERRLDDEKALRFEAQRPAARRLRAAQFDGYDDWYRWNDGTLEALVGNPPRWKAQTIIRTEWMHAVAALRDDPFEPVETLEGVVREFSKDFAYLSREAQADLCTRIRAWLAQQPAPTLTAAQHVAALVGMGAERRLYYDVHDDGDVPARCLVLPPEATP
jgi:FtsZ-binding cell division protein ZapB